MKSVFWKKGIFALLLTLLFATSVFAKTVTLSWDASPSDVTGYRVYYDTQSDGTFAGIDAIEGDSPIDVGDVLSYTVTGLYDDEDYYFAVTAYDGSGNESTYSNIVVSSSTATEAVNTAPVLASIGAKTVSEGSTLSFTVSGSDADGDTLTYTATSLPASASFNTATGAFSWSPDYTESGTYAVTFAVSDGSESVSETVSISVSDVNRAPVLSSIGSKSTSEGTALSFSVSATDSDNDDLTFSVSNLPSGASFDSADRYFSWTPGTDSAGSYQVTFTVSDGEATASEVVTISVGNINQAPVLSSIGSKSVAENATLSFSVFASDADGDDLTYSASNLPSGATFDSSDRYFTWTPGSTDAGTYSVTFSVSDGNATDSETVSITVGNVNRAPVLSSIGSQSVAENATLSFSVSASDADGDNLSYSASNLPAGASFDSVDRYFTWMPGSDAAGSYQVTFTVSDGSTSDSETVTISVANTNQAPVLSSIGSKSVAENATLSFSVSASDADGDNLSYSVTNLPAGGSFDSVDRYFTWTPGSDAAGTYQVTFTVSDGSTSDSETVTISVSNTNQAPVLSSIGTQSVAEGSSLSFSLSASDADGDDLVYAADNLPDGAVFDASTQTFSWIPAFAETENTRIYAVSFSVTDGSASDSETVTINVTNVNRAPVMDAIGAQSVPANNAFTLSISASDADNNTLTYSATNLPSGATFNAGQQVFSWTPTADQAGTYSVVFSASDGSLSASETVSFTVTSSNSAPVISGTADSSIMATYYYSFTPDSSDVDGDDLTFSISNKPSWASFDTTSGRLYGSPSESQTGTFSAIVISVTDGELTAALPSFAITVSAYVPVDTDMDGIPDSEDAFPNDSSEWLDTDGDQIGNVADTDDDNDGILDQYDSAPLDSSVSDWTVYAVAETGGYITPEGDNYLAYGSSQSFQIMPQAGYYISDLLVNGVSVGAVESYDVTEINQNYELIAEFTEIPEGLSIDSIVSGLPGVERVDGGDDSNNYVDGIPKLALDYQFAVNFRAADVTADTRLVYLVLNGYKYAMTLTSGSLATGAEYTVETRLGPAYEHNFYFVAEDLSGTEISRYPEDATLSGPVVELLDGRNVVAISADIDAQGLDSLEAFDEENVWTWLPEIRRYKKADSVGSIASGRGYIVRKTSSTTLPDLSSYGDVADDMMEIPVEPGWNLIGNPYGGIVELADIDVQVGNGVAVPWLNAVDDNIVVDGIYSYLGKDWGRKNEFASASGNTPAKLVPWIGYWVYINPSDSPVTLLIPKPLQ